MFCIESVRDRFKLSCVWLHALNYEKIIHCLRTSFDQFLNKKVFLSSFYLSDIILIVFIQWMGKWLNYSCATINVLFEEHGRSAHFVFTVINKSTYILYSTGCYTRSIISVTPKFYLSFLRHYLWTINYSISGLFWISLVRI